MSNSSTRGFSTVAQAAFQTTHWSLVLAAGESAAPGSERALEKLCQTYWYPLYAFIRRRGHSPHDAQDLAQEFFARLLEKKYFKLASPERGRFRSLLLKSLNHFLVNEWVRGQALKRGGGQKVISLDEEAAEQSYLQEPNTGLTPEGLYDKRWAVTVLEHALARLREDYTAAGKQMLFDKLKNLLLEEASVASYRKLADELGMSEGAVKVAVHRLRQRFREVIRTEIAHTVATSEDVDKELRCLMAALSS